MVQLGGLARLNPLQEPPPSAKILLDCRWLGRGGAGRITEMLLGELREVRPIGMWRLWGEERLLAPYVFPGAAIVPWSGDPTRYFGQADLLGVPAHDVAIYLHQIRPLRSGPSITFVLDTIPLRYGSRGWLRWVKGLFLRIACRLSSRLITISDQSRDSVVRDLHVALSKVAITTLSVDPLRVSRIRALRAISPRGDHILFVGRFAKHKNLQRLCRAFQLTNFRRGGGRLVLVGGSPKQMAAMSAFLEGENLASVEIRGESTEEDLDNLLASCRALVQPSLEEGFGLPAVEAAAVGVQVASSRVGFAPHIPAALTNFMDPLDELSIASAIDRATERGDSNLVWLPRSTLAADVLESLTLIFARQA